MLGYVDKVTRQIKSVFTFGLYIGKKCMKKKQANGREKQSMFCLI